MELPIELWNLIIDTHKFDLNVYKNCILVNSLFHKIIKNTLDNLPNLVFMSIRLQDKRNEAIRYYFFKDYANDKNKIIEKYDFVTLISFTKSEILSSKVIKFYTLNYNTQYTRYGIHIPLILNEIFYDNNKQCEYIDVVIDGDSHKWCIAYSKN